MKILDGPEIVLRGFWSIREQSVHKSKELHDTLVLAQVLMAFEEERVVVSV